MFKLILKHELKHMIRDKMYTFFLVYPIMMAFVSYFLIPYLRNIDALSAHLTFLLLLLVNSFIFGVILAFTLLDDQDDHVLLSLKITPISLTYYIVTKLILSYILGIISTLLIFISAKSFYDYSLFDVLSILILAPLQGPILALLIAAVSRNKVEGFVVMKLSGLFIMAPIGALFLTDWKEIALYIFPGFWTARIFSMSVFNLNYFLPSTFYYFIFGLLINLAILYMTFVLYSKKKDL